LFPGNEFQEQYLPLTTLGRIILYFHVTVIPQDFTDGIFETDPSLPRWNSVYQRVFANKISVGH